MFGGHLDVGQHQRAQSVDAGHQRGGIVLVQAVDVQDIAAVYGHGLSDARGGPAVGQRQVKDELATELAAVAA
jgi:hypothetical protein